jgi:hypothetical protein
MTPQRRRLILMGGDIFSPLSLSPALWLDASDASTLLQSSGGSLAASDADPVGEWRDKSGSGFHVSQSTSGAKPILKVGAFNGRNCVRFDGVDDRLERANVGLLKNKSGGSLFVVYKAINTSAAQALLFASIGTNSTITRAGMFLNNSIAGYGAGGRRLDVDSFSAIQGGAVNGNTHAQSAVFDWGNSDLFVHLDGAAIASTNSFQTDGSTSNTDLLILSIGGLTAVFANADIAAALIFERVLTASELAQLFAWSRSTWGTP